MSTRLLMTAVLWLALAPAASADAGLVESLRAGGFNIYFRHAQTDWSQRDEVRERGDWESCDASRIRQLSAEGRETAREVGRHMRALGVPVGKVLSSPYCRTVETARLLGVGEVQTTTDVMNMRDASYFGGRGAIVESARAVLASEPEPGTNTVIVAHGNVARNATPVYPGEAEGVVFRPDGRGGFSVVARLRPARWRELAERHASTASRAGSVEQR